MLQVEVKFRKAEATCDVSRHLGEDKRVLFAQMPCGKTVRDTTWENNQRRRFRFGAWATNRTPVHKGIDDVAQAHVYKCVSCQMALVGYVKRNIMTQQDVADLFMLGVDGKRTPIDRHKKEGEYSYHYRDYWGTGRSNVYSEDGILWHYGTIEAIRLHDGTIVDNSECWSKGRAYCPKTDTNYNLPLTTLSNKFNANLNDNLILNHPNSEDDDAVFRIRDKHGRVRQLFYDWRHSFLNELPEQCETVSDGRNILMPLEAHAAKHVYGIDQQGEFWFIPLKGLDDKDVANIKHAGKYCEYDDGQYLDKNKSHRATRTGSISYHDLNRWFPAPKGQTKLTVMVAKGRVTHTTRTWRRMLKLGDGNTWHAVFENRAILRMRVV